jgi:voltage-gated potassium channel
MTITTLSTVGFGELLPGMAQIPLARLWTVLLLLLGSGALVFFISSLTAFIVEGDIQDVFRRRRMRKAIDALKDHIIVVGIGTTGIHVATELRATRVPFVVVDSDEQRLRTIAAETLPGLLYVHGDATLDHVLELAGIARARGLATSLPEDRDNVFVTITARALNPLLRITSKVMEDSADTKIRRAGADATVSPSAIGGRRLVSHLLRPSVVQFLDSMLQDRSEVSRVDEVAIPDASRAIGATLGETNIREKTRALLLAVNHADGSYSYHPDASLVLERGAKLVVFGAVEEVISLRGGIADGSIGRSS